MGRRDIKSDAPHSARDIGARNRIARVSALAFVSGWFFLGGAGHFASTDFFVSILPAYVPHQRFVVLATGVLEIVGAVAVWSPRLRRTAGLALLAFTLCVTPVHIEMLAHAERYAAFGAPLLWLRLAFQPALMLIIWKATM